MRQSHMQKRYAFLHGIPQSAVEEFEEWLQRPPVRAPQSKRKSKEQEGYITDIILNRHDGTPEFEQYAKVCRYLLHDLTREERFDVWGFHLLMATRDRWSVAARMATDTDFTLLPLRPRPVRF